MFTWGVGVNIRTVQEFIKKREEMKKQPKGQKKQYKKRDKDMN